MTHWLRLFAVAAFALGALGLGGQATAQTKVPASRAEMDQVTLKSIEKVATGVHGTIKGLDQPTLAFAWAAMASSRRPSAAWISAKRGPGRNCTSSM